MASRTFLSSSCIPLTSDCTTAPTTLAGMSSVPDRLLTCGV